MQLTSKPPKETIAPTIGKSSILLMALSIFLPLTLNIKNPTSVISGFVGGATAATIINKSSGKGKHNNEIDLVSSENPIETPPSFEPAEAVITNESLSNFSEKELVFSVSSNVEKQLPVPALDSESTEVELSSNALISLLKERGIEVVKQYEAQESDELLEPIACYLANRYSVLKNLQRKIKASIANKRNFSFSLNGKSQHEIQSCTQYCSELYRSSLLSEYQYNRRTKTIRGKVQHRGDIIQFLNGGWFEKATLSQVKEKFNQCQDIEFLVNPHLKFSNDDRFELDLLFLIDRQLYWIECKTGNHYNDCLPKYCQHREELGVAKENAFLVGLELSKEDAEKWTKLWAITVVNPDGLAEKLTP